MKISMDNAQTMRWQDWTLVGLRLLYIIGMSGALFLQRAQQTTPPANDDLLIVAAGGGVGIVFLIGLNLIRSLNAMFSYSLMAFDWVLVGAMTHLSEADPVITLGAFAFLAATAIPRLGQALGAFHGLVLATVTYGLMLFQSSGQDLSQSFEFNVLIDTYAPTMIAIAIIGIALCFYAFMRSRYGNDQQQRLRKLAKEREEQLQRMQERSQAIYEMTTMVTGTLNFEKILESALDIGDMIIRNDSSGRVISAVMLFRSDDKLYITDARGLKPGYENKELKPNAGVLAEAFEEAMPIIAKNPHRDPVLGNLPGFNLVRSLIVVPLRANYDNFGALFYGTTIANAFAPDHVDVLRAIGVQATVALQNSVLYNNLMGEKERIIEMEEDARKALVRDLHDVPTQTISGVAMRVRIAMRMMERTPEEVPEELEVIEQMALRATEEIRHVLFKLRPLALESQGLTAALKQLAEKMQTTYQQPVTIRMSDDFELYLDETQQGALFYLVEEAVNNARKYAEASMITVQGKRKEDMLLIQIADNGKGFDAGAVNENYDDRGSFGMVNMRERAELLDATLTLKSMPGRGTTINVIIPADESRHKTDGHHRRDMPMTKLAASAQKNLSRLNSRL